jgi:hypothetical protein
MTIEPRFYAVQSPGPSSSWRRSTRTGSLVAWPPGTSVGPSLDRRDLPGGWGERVDHLLSAAGWFAKVQAAITADPITCAARFANVHGRCCGCGQRLQSTTDRLASACVGCRSRMAADVVTELIGANNSIPHTSGHSFQ